MRTHERMFCQTIRTIRYIFRDDRARIATCSLRTPTDRQTDRRGYVNTGIPNLVYNSLDVGTPYLLQLHIFVIEMTLGHVVTLPLWQVVTLLQWSR